MKPSVIIPLYNKFGSVLRSIDSLLVQTMQPYEILIVDDQSDDGGYERVRDYLVTKQPHYPAIHFRLFRNPANSGPGSTRNLGIDQSNGDIIFFLDADDAYTPRYVESVVNLMRDSPQVQVVISSISEEGTAIVRPNLPKLLSSGALLQNAGIITTNDFVRAFCMDPIFCACGNVVFRKSILGEIRFNEVERNYEDWLFFYELCSKVQTDGSSIAFLKDSIGIVYSSADINSLSRKGVNGKKNVFPAFLYSASIDARFKRYVYYNWLYSSVKRACSFPDRWRIVAKEMRRIRYFFPPLLSFLVPVLLLLFKFDLVIDLLARARKRIKYA